MTKVHLRSAGRRARYRRGRRGAAAGPRGCPSRHRGEALAGTVIVHHEVMDAEDLLMRQDEPGDGLHQLCARRLAKQRLMVSFAAVSQDQRMNSATAGRSSRPHQCSTWPSTQPMSTAAVVITSLRLPSCAVARRAESSSVVRLSPPQNSAIHSFKNGSAEDGKAQSRKRHRLGVQDLFEGRARQLRADKSAQRRTNQKDTPCARMAERMLLVRRPLRQAEAAASRARKASVRGEIQAGRRNGHHARTCPPAACPPTAAHCTQCRRSRPAFVAGAHGSSVFR